MRLDFICPGLPKCGTTTLDGIFRQHPRICLPSIKEPHFWSYYQTYQKGVEWYEKTFWGIDENHPQDNSLFYGEINPSIGQLSSKRLREMLGTDTKILIMLRNPVKRLWSHFNHAISSGIPVMLDESWEEKYYDNCTIEEMFDIFLADNFNANSGGGYIYTGMFSTIHTQFRYGFYCDQYFKFFPKENIRIILLEDFAKNPEAVCMELFRFIGIDPDKCIDYSLKKNEGTRRPKNEECRKKICELYKEKVEIKHSNLSKEELYKRYVDIIMEEKKYLIYSEEFKKEHMSNHAEELLRDYFADEKKYVEQILGRDLSSVWF